MNVQLTTDRGIQLCDDLNIKHVISTPNLIFFSDGDCLDSKVKEANEIVSEIMHTRLFTSKVPMLASKTSDLVNIAISKESNNNEQMHVIFNTMDNIKISFYADDIYIEKDCITISFYDENEFNQTLEKVSLIDYPYEGEVSGIFYFILFFEEYHKFHIHLNSESEYTKEGDEIIIIENSLDYEKNKFSNKAKKTANFQQDSFYNHNESINEFKNRLN